MKRRRGKSSAWWILAVSLLATGLAWLVTKSNVDKYDRTRFEQEVARVRDGLLDRMQRQTDSIRAIGASYEAFAEAQGHGWDRFVDSLNLEKTFPELGYIAFVKYSQSSDHTNLERQDTDSSASAPNSLWPGDIELLMGNRQEPHLDGESSRVLQRAAERSCDPGAVTMSRRAAQPSAHGEPVGVFILAPVCRAVGRDSTLRGWVVAFVKAADMMESLRHGVSAEVDIEVFEGKNQERESLVYDSDGNLRGVDGSLKARFHEAVSIEVAGRAWTLSFASTDNFALPVSKNQSAQVLLGGLAISVLLFDIALIMESTRSKALTIAELMTQRLRDSESQVRAIVDHAPDGIITFDERGLIATFNPGAEKLFGYSAEEATGKQVEQLMPSCFLSVLDTKPAGEDQPVRAACAGRELEGLRKDGTTFPVELTLSRMERGQREMFSAMVRDISERRRATEALRESEERYALAARAANDGLWDWDLVSDEIYYSPRWKAMLGVSDEEEWNRSEHWFHRVHSSDRSRLMANLADHLDGRTTHFEAEYRVLHQDGRYRWMLSRGMCVREETSKAIRIAGSQSDITARKEAEAQLLHDALYDSLTGLPNRAHFVRQLERASADIRRQPGAVLALLFLDLDRFKVVNDSLGHFVGDRLLIAFAERLKNCVRAGDTIARLGGDEFAILLVNLADVTEAVQAAERIQKQLGRPFKVGEHEVFAAVSIGISVSSTGEDDPENLLRDADIAMYRAKRQGARRYELFQEGMHTLQLQRLNLDTALRRALERDEFLIHYQPIVSVESGQIVACEALVRWQHPDRGLLPPGEFLPVAEETGVIIPLSEWLLRTACGQMQAWIDQGLQPIRMSVNISPRQLKQQNFFDVVSAALMESRLDPTLLQLELTESAIVENADATVKPLVELYARGVEVSLDDFGTGYSSLIYLQRLPINSLKIDSSFVRDITTDPGDAAIASGLIALAHSLKLRVTVEGVETEQQFAFLKSHQCDEAQGYYISPPVEAAAFARLLRQSTESASARNIRFGSQTG